MKTLDEAARDFLAQKRIAVVGVSRRHGEAANLVYRKLREARYQVFAVNPNAEHVEGDRCYPSLSAIEGGVDAVVIATHPQITPQIARECAELAVRRVWLHRSFGAGSASEEAIRLCREEGITVIPGACPLMFLAPVDLGHRCMRWLLGHTGGLPRTVIDDVETMEPPAPAPAAGSPGEGVPHV